MRGAGPCSWGASALTYLLLALLLLQGSTGVSGACDPLRGENCEDNESYDYPPEPDDSINELNSKIIECCNATRMEVLNNVKNISSTITTKIDSLANKDDVLATQSAVMDLQGKLDNTILNYTDHVHDKFTTLVEQLEANVTNRTYNISRELEDIKTISLGNIQDKINRNSLQILSKIQNLTEINGNLATKEGLNSTKDKLSVNIQNVQENVHELKQHLSKLVTKKDVENITNLVESLATKESLEAFEDKLDSLSKEETVNNLKDFVSSKIADKTDIVKTKEKITSSTIEIKEELSVLKNKLSDLAANSELKSLNTKVIGIDEKMNASRENVTDLKEVLLNLQKKQTEQNEILQKLAANVGKPINSEELENVETLIKSLQTTSTKTLNAVKNITSTGQSESNCMDSSEFSKKIGGLRKRVDNKCSTDGIKNDLEGMEERIQKRLNNITFCDKTEEPSPIKTIPEARSCEDSVFIDPPLGIDVCYSVVTQGLCNADPLFGFHCCQSCVLARQISSNGQHRYVNAPRKIYYNDVISFILSEKNY